MNKLEGIKNKSIDFLPINSNWQLTKQDVEWLIKEIEKLQDERQVLSHYKFMYEQAKY